MMKKFRFIYLILIIYALSISNTFAYLDPGSGSIILQAIIAGIATAGATIVFYWRKIKMMIKKLFVKKEKNSSEK